MRIGLLVLSIGNFGNKDFYNLQEVGLARELDGLFDEVLIYRLIEKHGKESVERLADCRNATLHLLPSGQLGSNGIPDLKRLDASMDLLVCFSDTQLFFPSVCKWCVKNSIKLIPYIGVCKSNSGNQIKQLIMTLLSRRNLRLYKKLTCLAKTPEVRNTLIAEGVQNVTVAPVGLDMSKLKADSGSVPKDMLKEKYGFTPDDRVILFIGRMTAEKQPCRMIDIFRDVLRADNSFRLLMVGNGELSDTVSEVTEKYGLSGYVTRIERIPNSDIWELYRASDCLVNLNQHEIYGMVLLEAMYYGCRVIAWHAPGPDYIISDGVTGFLTGSNEEVCERILDGKPLSGSSRAAVLNDFSWNKTAGIICALTE